MFFRHASFLDTIGSVPPNPPSLSEPATPAPAAAPQDPVEQMYTELVAKVRESRARDDLAPLEAAYRFACEFHKGQMRDSGEIGRAHV